MVFIDFLFERNVLIYSRYNVICRLGSVFLLKGDEDI